MSFGITELIIILVIVVLLFGTTKLKSLGGDLGSAIKGFRNAVSDDDKPEETVAEADAQLKQKETEQKEAEKAE